MYIQLHFCFRLILANLDSATIAYCLRAATVWQVAYMPLTKTNRLVHKQESIVIYVKCCTVVIYRKARRLHNTRNKPAASLFNRKQSLGVPIHIHSS